ncbi:MAG: hypothetical protein ACYC6A_23785 [Armatimonadota bacterium]
MLIILLLAVAAGGWLAWRWLNPRLTPVTAKHYENAFFIYSANGYGFPAYLTTLEGQNIHGRCLDDQGKPYFNQTIHFDDRELMVSPTRQVIAWPEEDRATGIPVVVVRAWKDGRITRKPGSGNYLLDYISDSGLIPDYGALHYLTAEGHQLSLSLPKDIDGCDAARLVESLDPDLLPLVRETDLTLYIYDLAQKRMAIKFPSFDAFFGSPSTSPTGPTLLMRHGSRIAAIPYVGRARVWDGKTTAIMPGTDWYWGEDGTAWTYLKNELSVLQWRQGTPLLKHLSIKAQRNPRINTRFGGVSEIAVWGDGEMVAQTTLRSVLPQVIVHMITTTARRANRPPPSLRDRWQLALYHRGRLVGRYHVVLPPSQPDTYFEEHLAFTADGKYLAWVIDYDDGHNLYVFPTGR